MILTPDGENLVINNIRTQYGINLNGAKVYNGTIMHENDFLSIANYSFYYSGRRLFFDNDGISGGMHIKQLMNESTFKYPLFIRNSRVKEEVDTEKIQILEPSKKPEKLELNIVTSLMPTLGMFALIVILRAVLNFSGGMYIIFSICSMGLGVVTSILSIVKGQSKYRKECRKRYSEYNRYIHKKREEIACAREMELNCLKDTYYSINQDLLHINKFDSTLFDRIPGDDDFLDVYLGTGRVKALKEIDYKKKEMLEDSDDLATIPIDIAKRFEYVEGAPIVMKLKDANAVGIVAPPQQQYQMFKNIVTDIVSRQYYGDVRLYAILNEDTSKYEWLKLLPHIQNPSGVRNIICNNESKNNIYEYLYKELSYRMESKTPCAGYNVILVVNEYGIKSHPISKFIEKAAELNTVFIFFEEKEELLPLYCSRIARIEDSGNGYLYQCANKAVKNRFVYESIDDSQIWAAARKLSPVYCEEISLESSLRKSISLYELIGIYSAEDLNISERWKKSKVYDSMAVPLGVNAKNDIVSLDLHEKFHGPHGLVAGTTGSGKSEILQTYILGAATLFHPYEVGFVIIDFKGGGMVNQFKNLPHLIGAITNIDGKEIDRSLKSIKAELLKRQNLFAQVEVNHIDKYIKLYKEGKVTTALPHLVIIVDEFAELKAEQPEFMKELISAARIGRSLGVHLILATQKPSGQVNEQIWSNSKFKLCLKVQTQEDSNEVLRSPLAAEIREPGRAYLQVGNNEIFELFQSGFSGAPAQSDDNNIKEFEISSINFCGKRKIIFKQEAQKKKSNITQLEAVVDYISRYCRDNNIKALPHICLPALEHKIFFNHEKYALQKTFTMKCLIGIYDDPDNQRQDVATLDIATQNTVIIGASQYGKTNLVEVLIRNLTGTYSPDDINIYIIDFGSMVLKNFEKLNHVGGVVCPSDDEKLKNLFKYLTDQVEYRRKKMLDAGVSSFLSYKEAGYRDMPHILVIIDNFTGLRELFLQDDDVLLTLCREGISVGITFVITNSLVNGINYKYLSNIAGRVALFCNEHGEYSSLFAGNKIYPDDTPGRGIVEVDKTLYECQTFLAFDGEREIDRVKNMHEFIERINNIYPGMSAVPIPEIPDMLMEDYIFSNFKTINSSEDKFIVGLDYETIAPCIIDIVKNNLIAVTGREESGKANFIKYFMHYFLNKGNDTEIYVFDNYKKKLRMPDAKNVYYYMGTNAIKQVFTELGASLDERYDDLVNDVSVDKSWRVIVINNADVINAVSADKEALQIFKNAIGKYKMLNVFFIFGDVPNVPIPYGTPEVYRCIRDEKNIVFFDDLENCKIVDVAISDIRNNKKRITIGDGYYIVKNECHKVKTPLALNDKK